MDFLARLAALVPRSRVNLTRYHGVFAPNHRLRGRIVPARRGAPSQTLANKHVAMSWAQRLKRVFGIQIERCEQCGGRVKILARIEDEQVIAKILTHLGLTAVGPGSLPPVRGPPGGELAIE